MTDAPSHDSQGIPTIGTRIKALESENKGLRDGLREALTLILQGADVCDEVADKIESLEAENKRLREALEEAAEMLDIDSLSHPQECAKLVLWVGLILSKVRAALEDKG